MSNFPPEGEDGQPKPGESGQPGQPAPQWAPPGWQPGQGYGYPGGYLPPKVETDGTAVAVLVLGIVSLLMLFCYGLGFIPAIVALCLAPGSRRNIERSQGKLGGEGMVKAGAICSWVTLGIVALFVLVVAVFLVVGALSS